MARKRRARSRRYTSRRTRADIGRERARAHVEAALRLSEELGGSDQIVKQYFFSLSWSELAPILHEYGQKFGDSARKYAVATIPKWRSGQRRMSGLVAERLYGLLPRYMPLTVKHQVSKALWEKHGPTSRRLVLVGPNASVQEVERLVAEQIAEDVKAYSLPEAVRARFKWLADSDIDVQHQLLNELRRAEVELVKAAAHLKLPALLDHLRSADGEYTQRLSEVFTVGKHEIEIRISRDHTGTEVEVVGPASWRPRTTQDPASGAALFLIVGFIAVVVVLIVLGL